MGKNKDVTIFILIAFLGLGVMWGPMKNAKTTRSAEKSSGANLIAVGEVENEAEVTPKTNKEISGDIKEVRQNIEKLQEDLQKQFEESKRSPYYGKITVSNISGLNNADPDKEYITMRTNLKEGEKVNITGWYFKSEVTGNRAVIGRASLLPYPFKNNEVDVVLVDGDKVVLTKGYSPIGISFRTNICTGFFEENRTFTPGLPRQCPRPIDEDLPKFSNDYDREEECLKIIKRIPVCTTKGSSFTRDLPDTVTSSCKEYITKKINYNSCVLRHVGDNNFPGNEYRLYLKSFAKLWRPRDGKEVIHLYDWNGLIVDTISYN